jgi:hypothetical protein
MKTLTRNHAGFVHYPSDFPIRVLDGTARFRTKCDMLVGPCSCGDVHQEWDIHTIHALRTQEAVLETLTLVPVDGVVKIPRFWLHVDSRHYHCDVFSGECRCGKTHTANEHWVKETLQDHNAKIIFFEEADLPTVQSQVGAPLHLLRETRWANRRYLAADRKGVYTCR